MSEFLPEFGPKDNSDDQNGPIFDVDATIERMLNPEAEMSELHMRYLDNRLQAVGYLSHFIDLEFDNSDPLTVFEECGEREQSILLAMDNIAVAASELIDSPDRQAMIDHAYDYIEGNPLIDDLDKDAMEDCLVMFVGDDSVAGAEFQYMTQGIRDAGNSLESDISPHATEKELRSKVTLIKSVLDSLYVPRVHDDYQAFVGLLAGILAVPGCISSHEEQLGNNFRQYARRLKISPASYKTVLKAANLPEDTKISN